jgi:AraC-like DNA-binding protein
MSHGNVIRNYSDIYLRAVRILEDQKVYLDDSLTISKLSALTGTNRTYLSRAFSNSGINFPEYINRLRITNIKRRVEEMIEKKEDILLEDLAIMCGYGSARTMNRNFVKSEGITVYAYIKEIRCKL